MIGENCCANINRQFSAMSSAGYKAKVLLAGPCKTGKTAIANFLADATEVSGSETDYWPTHVVRILEFEQVYGTPIA